MTPTHTRPVTTSYNVSNGLCTPLTCYGLLQTDYGDNLPARLHNLSRRRGEANPHSLRSGGLFRIIARNASSRSVRLSNTRTGPGEEFFFSHWLMALSCASFLTGYGIELCLLYFAYFPLLVTVMFVGYFRALGDLKR